MNALSPRALAEPSSHSSAGCDAELIALCTQFDEIERRHSAVFAAHTRRGEEDAADNILEIMAAEHEPVLDRILDLSPTTLDGAIAIAASLQNWSHGDFARNSSTDELLASTLIEGLARMSPSAGLLRFRRSVNTEVANPVAAPSPALLPDAEIIALCLRHARNWAALNAAKPDDDDPRWEERSRILDALDHAQPLTLTGLAAKAAAAQLEAKDRNGVENLDQSPTAETWAWHLVKDITRLAAGGGRPPTSADADLIQVCAAFRASESAICEIYDEAPDDDEDIQEEIQEAKAAPIFSSWDGMLDRMGECRATTHEGLLARVLALAQHSGMKPGDREYAFGFNASGQTVTGRLLHYLLRDAVALLRPSAPNPDADLLALEPEYLRLRAAVDAENARTDCDDDDVDSPIFSEFDQFCYRIARMPPASTQAGRALKAIAVMHQLSLMWFDPSQDDGAEGACWEMLKQEVGGAYRLPGERP